MTLSTIIETSIEEFLSWMRNEYEETGGEIGERDFADTVEELIHSAVVETLKAVEVEKVFDTQYIRNHTLPPHGMETLTNVERAGWNAARDEQKRKAEKFLSDK